MSFPLFPLCRAPPSIPSIGVLPSGVRWTGGFVSFLTFPPSLQLSMIVLIMGFRGVFLVFLFPTLRLPVVPRGLLRTSEIDLHMLTNGLNHLINYLFHESRAKLEDFFLESLAGCFSSAGGPRIGSFSYPCSPEGVPTKGKPGINLSQQLLLRGRVS